MTNGERLIGGRYKILRELAAGGMGTVYEARHALSQKIVALKVLHSHIAGDERSRQRFLREVSAPAQIGHHGICDVYDAGFDDQDGSVFFAMELLDGETLRARLERDRLTLEEFFQIFEQLLDALAAAHAKGIVHRDLKPENVFLVRTKDGAQRVKLVDFGIVRDVSAEEQRNVTQAGTAMGTPEYMSPEQATNAADVTTATDVWAVGVMMYEALGGKTPFTGASPTIVMVSMLTEPHPPITTLAPSAPRALVELIDGCLSKSPAERPRDAAVLLNELRSARRAIEIPPTFAFSTADLTPPASASGPQSASGTGSVSGPFSNPGPFSSPGPSGGPAPAGAAPGPFGAPAPAGAAPGPFGAPASGTSPGPFAGPHTSPAGGSGYAAPLQTPPGSYAGATPMPGAVPPPDASRSFATGTTQKRGSRAPLIIVALLFGLVVLGGGLVAVLFTVGVFGGPAMGQLRVQSVIQDAELWVDGTARGPLTEGRILELPAGPHVVEARSSGSVVATQSVRVRGKALVEVLLVAQAVAGITGPEQRFRGALALGDARLSSGELFDTYSFEWPANLNVRVELSSDTFDTYVIVKKPDGTQVDNDDSPTMPGTGSALNLITPTAGSYQVLATTYQRGEMGAYELVVRTQ